MAIIYKLVSKFNPLENDLIYIGSSKQGDKIRLSKHKHDYKRYLNGKYHYVSSFKLFEQFGINGVDVEILEHINSDNKFELLEREKHYINALNCVNLNYKL